MHIRFQRPLRGDYGRAKVGDVKLVTKEIGKSLVKRGLAVEVDGPADGAEEAEVDTQTEVEGQAETPAKARKGKPE